MKLKLDVAVADVDVDRSNILHTIFAPIADNKNDINPFTLVRYCADAAAIAVEDDVFSLLLLSFTSWLSSLSVFY